jgi:hypothetical protein
MRIQLAKETRKLLVGKKFKVIMRSHAGFTPLQLVIRRVAPNCSISMEKAQEWVWHLVLSLSYPHQTLSDI